MTDLTTSYMPFLRRVEKRAKCQEFFNMTGSCMMTYSPATSSVSDSISTFFRDADSDANWNSSSESYQSFKSTLSSKEEPVSQTEKPENWIGDKRNRNLRNQSTQWQPGHSTPSEREITKSSRVCPPLNSNMLEVEHEGRDKFTQYEIKSNRHGSVISFEAGRGGTERNSSKETQTVPVCSRTGVRIGDGREIWSCSESPDLSSNCSFELTRNSKSWLSAADSSISAADHEKKRVSFGVSCGQSGNVNGELLGGKKENSQKSILKTTAQQGDIFEERSDNGCPYSAGDFQTEKIVNSASLIKKRLSEGKRSSDTHAQALQVLDFFGCSLTPLRPESYDSESHRRKSAPAFPTAATTNEERDNAKNAEKAEHRTRGYRRLEDSSKSRSTSYLMHLKNTERISKHVQHIIDKFQLVLLDEKFVFEEKERVDSNGVQEISSAINVTCNNNVIVNENEPKAELATAGINQPLNPEDVEKRESQTRSFSLRRPLAKFQKKMDKSKSVAGSTLDKAYREEFATRRPLSTALHAKDSESSVAENSEPKMATSAEGKLKKPRRKFSLNLFRKSRDKFTEASSKDRDQSQLKTERDKVYKTMPQMEDISSPRKSDYDVVGNAKRASSEATKVFCYQQQQFTLPESSQDSAGLLAEKVMPSEADKQSSNQGSGTKHRSKVEWNRELSIASDPRTSQGGSSSVHSSSHVIIPLVAKTALAFQDAVYYYPSERKQEDEEERTGAAASKSEGKVPKPSKSSSLRVPAKGAISDAKDQMVERRPSLLKRVRAFFGRSVSSSQTVSQEHPSSTLLKEGTSQNREGKIEEWSGTQGLCPTGQTKESLVSFETHGSRASYNSLILGEPDV